MKKGFEKRNSFLTVTALVLIVGLLGPPPATALPIVDGTTEALTTDVTYSTEWIGYSADGTLNHYSGTNTVTANLFLGFNSGVTGYYNLIGGTLSAFDEGIGYNGIGVFYQSGGTHNVSNYLYLGANPGSSGTYYLSGTGILSASD